MGLEIAAWKRLNAKNVVYFQAGAIRKCKSNWCESLIAHKAVNILPLSVIEKLSFTSDQLHN